MPSWLLEFLVQTIDSVNCVTEVGNETEKAQQRAGYTITTRNANVEELSSPQIQEEEERFEADDDDVNEGDGRATQPKQVVPREYILLWRHTARNG